MIESKKITLLNQTTLDSMGDKNDSAVIKKVTDVALKILEADFGFAWWKLRGLNKYDLVYKTLTTPYNPHLPRRHAANEIAHKSRVPVFVESVKREDYPPGRDVSPYMKTYVIIPVTYADKIYGNLVLCYKKKHIFSEADKSLCVALGNTAAQAITINRLVKSEHEARQNAEKQEARFRALIENSYDIIALLNKEGKITYISPSASRIAGYETAHLVGRNFKELIHPGDLPRVELHIQKILKNPAALSTLEFRAVRRDGSHIWLESTAVNLLDNASVRSIIANLRDVTSRRQSEESIRKQALHDPLTNLFNRQEMSARLFLGVELARQNKSKLAFLFFDIDHFKKINDKYGHGVGDELLKIIGRRLLRIIRAEDMVARMGGDEFVILLNGIHSENDAISAANEILKSIKSRIKISRHALNVTASLGIAVYPKDGKTKEALLKRADRALYHAKRNGRNRYYLYSRIKGESSAKKIKSKSKNHAK